MSTLSNFEVVLWLFTYVELLCWSNSPVEFSNQFPGLIVIHLISDYLSSAVNSTIEYYWYFTFVLVLIQLILLFIIPSKTIIVLVQCVVDVCLLNNQFSSNGLLKVCSFLTTIPDILGFIVAFLHWVLLAMHFILRFN